MAIRIKQFEHDGSTFISVDKVVGNKWYEKSFEYTNDDKLPKIISLLESAVNNVIDYE